MVYFPTPEGQKAKEYLKQYEDATMTIKSCKALIDAGRDLPITHQNLKQAQEQMQDIATTLHNSDIPHAQKVLLEQKYLCHNTLDAIAPIINYSKRQTERLHLAGLHSFGMTLK